MSFLGTRSNRRPASARNRRPTYRPYVEALEDRRLLNAGALDPTFGNGGIVQTPALRGSLDDEADRVFVQPNGQLMVVGVTQPSALPNGPYAITISRYQASGSLDTTYGSGGTVTTGLTSPNYIQPTQLNNDNVVCQPDGSIVILWGNEVTRYGPSGTLDTGFGSNGFVVPSGFCDLSGNPSGPNALALQSDGKILITGSTLVQPDVNYPVIDVLLERLNSDGSLDTSFGTGGKVIQNLGLNVPNGSSAGDQSWGASLAIQPDGAILVAGGVSAPLSGAGIDPFVARFQPNNGNGLDTSFGNGGESVLVQKDNDGDLAEVGAKAVPLAVYGSWWSTGLPQTATSVTLQADGKMLVGIFSGNTLIRLNQNGTLNSGFARGAGGQNGISLPEYETPFVVDGGGGILVPEINSPQDPVTGNHEFDLTRYNPDGSPDLSFGSNGTGTALFPIASGADSYAGGLAVQSDGKIVVVGTASTDNQQTYHVALARLTGSLFSSSGLQSALTSGGTVTLQATTPTEASAALSAVNSLDPATTPASTVVVDLGGQTVHDSIANVPPQVTLHIVNGTFIGGSPALIVQSGQVVVENSTFSNATDAPTILVTGGNLTLRGDSIQENTGFSDPAISVTGGTVDLGAANDPGGNTINVNGSSTFIRNTTTNPVAAVGDTFAINGQVTAWPIALTVTTSNSLMLVGNSPPPLTGSINGTPFTGAVTYTTALGDQVTVTLGTTATSASAVGQYAITATLSGADAGNYVIDPATSKTGTLYVVSVGADPSSTTGAQAVTFWDNKGNAKLITGADLSSLDALNLVTQGGSAFDPHAVQQLQAWLSVSPNATTAYQLAVQLAAMDLNVLTGYVHATDLVYAGALLPYASAYGITGLTSGGFIDVQDLMSAANAILAQVSPGAPSGDPNQAYEAALAQVLLAADANKDFVTQELTWNLVSLYLAGQLT
jgi:uncharacterized delta-60 repeat protein